LTEIAIVDSSAMLAVVDERDPAHRRCLDVLQRQDLRLVIPALCVAETAYLTARSLGPHVEAGYLSQLAEMDVRAPEPEDWPRIGALVRQYADFPLGGTDASVIVLAERLGTDIVVSVDRRHFTAVRPAHCESLRVLPD
jgi:uncharacterized protein